MFLFKLAIGIIADILIFAVLLFLPAGTLTWPHAWIFMVVVAVGTVASAVHLYRTNRDLLVERMKMPVQKGQPLADKVIVLLFIASFFGVILFIPVDVFRLHLFPRPGTIVSSAGLILFVVGWCVIGLALRENPFAASVVRLQEERHHRVIDTGVYGTVRHPMYGGCIPLLVGMALWLESWAACLLAVVPMGLLVVRIMIEERFLRRELEGYEAYTRKVRYRMIPRIW